jgi:hypothetical protein
VAPRSILWGTGGRQVRYLSDSYAVELGACATVARQVVKPIALPRTLGAWYRTWRLVSVDGSTFDVADEKVNEDAFSRPGASRGSSAYPQIRFVSLVENGTHVLFGSQMDGYRTGEITLAKAVLPSLKKGMLCLADRNFFGLSYGSWRQEPSGPALADEKEHAYGQ